MGMRRWLLVVLLLEIAPVAGVAAHTPVHQTDLSCIKQAVVELAAAPAIIKAVADYNARLVQPFSLDEQWEYLQRADPDVQRVLTHPVAGRIHELIERLALQGEGFLIGANGGLVAATNKTTDYYQGDEPQFVEAMALPQGDVYIMEGVSDVSARSILVKVATPVYHHMEDRPLGVLVVGLDQFVLEYLDPCTRQAGGAEPSASAQ